MGPGLGGSTSSVAGGEQFVQEREDLGASVGGRGASGWELAVDGVEDPAQGKEDA
ncbi:hypothetical protein [Streptomyces sp. NPDC057545]|uniref:hypothetical protein n=1 Tax=Streptomyces sp. NPDC057545 TaxID=3346164 RepID=UPI003685E8B7